MENRNAIILGILGGFLLLIAERTGGVPIWLWLPLILGIVIVPGIAPILWIVLISLHILTLFGGFTVWGGVFLLWRKHYWTGKFLMGVGTGFGLTSLVFVTLIAMIFPVLGTIMFWLMFTFLELIGIICCILARYHVQDPSKVK